MPIRGEILTPPHGINKRVVNPAHISVSNNRIPVHKRYALYVFYKYTWLAPRKTLSPPCIMFLIVNFQNNVNCGLVIDDIDILLHLLLSKCIS